MVRELNSINDLRNIDFDRSVPKHSLQLLHWFANRIYIDSQNNIWLTFDPNTNYGSHHYGNFDGLLEPLPRGHQYFTVGNLNKDSSEELPDYVVHPIEEFDGRNSDRIIFRVRQQNTGRRRIDRVYLTQHEGAPESPYDPDHTYEVTTNLLREIRQLGVTSLEDLADHFGGSVNELNNIRSRGGELASLRLLLFIVLQIRNYSPPSNYRNQSAVRFLIPCIAVFFIFILVFIYMRFFSAPVTKCKNPQTVLIKGYNAHLQVFVKDGKACARLCVDKSFGEWKSEFSKSWIGFYTSEDKATNDYEWWQWQWATKFKPSTDYDNALYDAYEYHSDMAIAPGVQARFILRDDEVRARTPSWT